MSLRSMQTAQARAVLHVYHPVGFPAPGQDIAYLEAAIAGGAQVLELGLPFSDPVADGPVLQRAATQAIAAGSYPVQSIATIKALRSRHPDVGIVVMAYANTLHSLGWNTVATAFSDAGVDAVIVPDMPLRESAALRDELQRVGIGLIPLISSTVPAATIAQAAAQHPPFLYAASLGVTGQAGPGVEAETAIQRIQATAPTARIAVGFGVRNAADVRRMQASGAHGVIVGSALVSAILDGASPQQYQARVAALREGLA